MRWIKTGKEMSVKEVFCRNIGVDSLEDVNRWFKKYFSGEYWIKGLKEAVELSKRFMNRKVRIIGDYDVDGITSVWILKTGLELYGFKDVEYKIPLRFTEGFGIKPHMIEGLHSGDLIITCDNGITGIEAIRKAKERGITVIVIDHHEADLSEDKSPIYPPADIIIDPNAIPESSEYSGYCGAGLCYKFISQMFENDTRKYLFEPVAAIGTICDVMELREENYAIVRNGLKHLKDPSFITSGLHALLCSYELDRNVTAHDVGFKIGPAINAASRMKDDGAYDALNLLLYNGPFPKAVEMAMELVKTNDARKIQKKAALGKAEEIIREECLYGDVPLIIYIPNINEGIIGIVAGNLCEKYKVPIIVLTDAVEEDCLKGSARSCGNYHMYNKLANCKQFLVKYGGHKGAAGMTIKKELLEDFRSSMINSSYDFLMENTDIVSYDLEIDPGDIPKTIEELKKYEPFGKGNSAPAFLVRNIPIHFVSYVGEKKDIVKLISNSFTMIGFDMKDQILNKDLRRVDCIATLSANYFNGKEEPQAELISLRKGESNVQQTPLAKMIADMAKKK